MAPAPLRAGAGGPSSHSGDAASLKVFVGGLDQSVNDIDFRTHFEQFGRITDAVIMFDRITKRSRGFGFVTYEDVGAMQVLVCACTVWRMLCTWRSVRCAATLSTANGSRQDSMSSGMHGQRCVCMLVVARLSFQLSSAVVATCVFSLTAARYMQVLALTNTLSCTLYAILLLLLLLLLLMYRLCWARVMNSRASQ
jgi:RNA recognition motif. (a.k.a. RRM, RBD, or RNP domain)